MKSFNSNHEERSAKLEQYERRFRAVIGDSEEHQSRTLYYPLAEPLGGPTNFVGEAHHGFARPFRRLTAGPAMGDLRAKDKD